MVGPLNYAWITGSPTETILKWQMILLISFWINFPVFKFKVRITYEKTFKICMNNKDIHKNIVKWKNILLIFF